MGASGSSDVARLLFLNPLVAPAFAELWFVASSTLGNRGYPGTICIVSFRAFCCWMLMGLAGCHSEGRGRRASTIDPAAYPPCDVPSDAYQPDKPLNTPGAPVWIRRFGCQADDRAMGVVIEHDGNVVATGSFSGRVSFGDAPLISGGKQDAFVVRWDAKGKPVWSLRLGGLNSEAQGTNIMLGATGELMLAGRFHGVLDATQPQLLSRGLDPFVLMMSKDGSFLWARRFERAGTSEHARVPVAGDAMGGTLVALSPSNPKADDGVVVRVDPSGDIAGQVPLAEGTVASVAVHANRSVLLAGFRGLPHSQKPKGLPRVTGSAPVGLASQLLFLTKIDDQARRVWWREIGDARVRAFGEPLLMVDPQGYGYLAFSYQGEIDVGTGTMDSSGGFDIVMMKLDPAGRTVWARAFAGPQGNEWVNGLAVDPAGHLAVGGAFEAAVDFGGGPIMSAGPISGFVAIFDSLGRHLWSRVFGAQQSRAVVESVSLGAENVAVAGSFQGWRDFGGGLVPSAGQWDGFVALLRR